jgi:NAD(P)-dependent dehydrogenase (short-subunit alcohol dehydrogenase family)
MDSGLRGRKALITGGSTGIGLGIAKSLAAEGVDVAVASRNPDPKGVEDIRAFGVKAVSITADVSKEEQVVRMVQEAKVALGGLDLYVNNAAAHWDEAVTKLTAEGWFNTINTDLSSCVFACREASRLFIDQGQGSILIVGSTAMYQPLAKETAYRVAKTGLKVYMEVLATELAPHGIRVNMLVPGFFLTKLVGHFTDQMLESVAKSIPLQRIGDTNAENDVGPSAVLLLSDRLSPFTAGAVLDVAGGDQMNPNKYYSYDQVREMNL